MGLQVPWGDSRLPLRGKVSSARAGLVKPLENFKPRTSQWPDHLEGHSDRMGAPKAQIQRG